MLFFILVSLLSSTLVYASNPNNVVDFLDYLSESEIEQLQTRIDTIKDSYTLDTVIVITDNTDGKSSMDYADDYYDYNEYGLDSQYSGLLMLINMDQREVWISTTGRAIDIFTDGRISTMVSNVTGELSNANYYYACTRFIDNVDSYARLGKPNNQYREEREPSSTYYSNPSYLDKVSRLMGSWIVYIIAFIIAIASTLIISYSSKGKVTIHSQTYEEGGSFVLSQNTDQYIRETTTRTKIQTESSGGRSSTHGGSSGRSHGGGGGKF